MSRKHSTLLKEEIDDESGSSGSGGDKKKQEKEKDGGERRKKSHKKVVDRNEGYYNDSMTKSSKIKPNPIGTAAVNPTAETLTSPTHSQTPGVVPPPLQPPPQSHQGFRHQVVAQQQSYNISSPMANTQGYTAVQGGAQQVVVQGPHAAPAHWQQQQPQRLPPPPGQPHMQMVQQPFQQMQTPPQAQAQFSPQGQHPQQQVQEYQPHLAQQGFYPGAQYPQGVPNQVPGQVVAYQGHPMVHPGMVPGQPGVEDQAAWHPVAPQSPTNQGQMHEPTWPQHVEGNWSGQPGAVDPNWNQANQAMTSQTIPNQAMTSVPEQRDGNWAAFQGDPTDAPGTAHRSSRKEITWKESPDNSSSDEEIERSSSPELAGEEGEGLLRAPSLTSFAESTSSVEDEAEENPWKIQPEQHEYYTKQFKKLQPNEGGVIKGPKARDFFLKSNLHTETLSKIWHLSDINKDNALNLFEFCIAMHLVVAIRHGLELPSILPDVLLYYGNPNTSNGGTTSPLSDSFKQDDIDDEEHSRTKPIPINNENDDHITEGRPRSLSDPSINEDHQEVSRKTSMPASALSKSSSDNIQVGHMVGIERPKPKAKFSLLDSLPGQLLPPPSGKFAGWTPSKSDRQSYSGESDEDSDEDSDTEERPLSPGQTLPAPMPSVPEDEDSEPKSPHTPPSSPRSGSPIPAPVLPDLQQVTRRLSKKSNERPKSAGDVNEMKEQPDSETSSASTPTNSSIGSDGKKEPPPPPPPRNKKGHSRSSSLDLNKLFAAKGKESRANTIGSPTSSQSSHTSQSSEVALPLKTEAKEETKQDQEDTEETRTTPEPSKKSAKEENFADFSNFEDLVKAQGTSSDSQMAVPSQGRNHRRSLSLDQGQEYWPKKSKVNNTEASTSNGPSKIQEALPRPVPKLKPPGSPPVKLLKLHDRTPKKDGNEERKLKTEPPKIVVKPLTKEAKLQTSIRDLKDKNLLLSRLNSELQQETKETMEQRISLELKLERLKPFTSK